MVSIWVVAAAEGAGWAAFFLGAIAGDLSGLERAGGFGWREMKLLMMSIFGCLEALGLAC